MQDIHVKRLTLTGMLIAVMLVLEATGLGIIKIPPAGVTIQHVPIIIGTLIGGLAVGLPLGLAFGLISMYEAYTTPMLLSVCFMNPLVAIVPRVLIPVAVWAAARATGFYRRQGVVSAALGAVAGSLCNTVLVIGLLCALYAPLFAQSLGVEQSGVVWAAVAFGAVSGLPEAAVAALITVPVAKALVRTGFGKMAMEKQTE